MRCEHSPGSCAQCMFQTLIAPTCATKQCLHRNAFAVFLTRKPFGNSRPPPSPFSLTQGDLHENVKLLRNTPITERPAEEFARQMCVALQCGMAPRSAVETLNLARHAPCTTNMIEQAHGLSATSMGYHSTHC